MKLLFDVDTEGNVLMHDSTIVLVPQLRDVYNDKTLGSDAIKYLVLCYDYNSPYRNLPEDKRKEEVIIDVYNKKKVKALDSLLMQEAIEKYRILQYDPIVEQYMVCNQKLAEYNEFVKSMPIDSKNAKELQGIMIGQEKLVETRERIKEIITKKEEDDSLMGGGGISFLEEYHHG